MSLPAHIREHTHEPQDALKLLDQTLVKLSADRNVSEQDYRRAAAEMTAARAREEEERKLFAAADISIAELQTNLEKVERQRSELLDRLVERQEERRKADKLLKAARSATDKCQEALNMARQATEVAQHRLEEAEAERGRQESRSRAGYRIALDEYQKDLGRKIEQAFATEQERQEGAKSAERFKKARHEDPHIADLCEQREQLRDLLKRATVPGVKQTLQLALHNVEAELERLFPSSTVEKSTHATCFKEDIYVYQNQHGTLTILLPMSPEVWKEIELGKQSVAADRSMRIIASLIAKLGLKPSDGEFELCDGRCVFASNFSPDMVTALDSISVPIGESGNLEFVFSSLSAEVQEAIVHDKVDV